MRKLVILLALMLFGTTACWPFSQEDDLSSMELEVVNGKVEILRDGDKLAVADRVSLETGDVIVTAARSAARLQLEEGRNAQLGSESRALVVDTTTIESQTGSLLAEADGSMTVTFGDARTDASDALFRIDRAPGSTRAASYRGSVRLRVPGDRSVLEPFWQTSVTANDLDGPRPYRLVASDLWDRTYLEPVIELDEELTLIARGLKSQLGNEKPPLSYFEALASGRKVPFMKSFLKRVGTTDLFIGFSLGLEYRGGLEDGVGRAFDYRDQGARWGIAAAIMDVPANPLMARLDGVIDSTGVATSAPGGEVDFALAASELTGEGLPSDDDVGIVDDNNKDDNNNDDDNPDPKPTPNQCENSVDCGVDEAEEKIDEITDPDPSPSPSLLELPNVP